MTGGRLLVACALVLLGTLVVPCSGDRQLSGDPRTGGDDELNRATPACPGDFTSCGGRCYHAIATTDYTYTAAEQYCIGMGAILATPRSAAENECAKDVAAAAESAFYFWIGYRGGNTADSFVGADGGKMTYSNWYTGGDGEPDLDDADNCVAMYSGVGVWEDNGCQHSVYVLCQMQS